MRIEMAIMGVLFACMVTTSHKGHKTRQESTTEDDKNDTSYLTPQLRRETETHRIDYTLEQETES